MQFILLTRLSPDAARSPASLEDFEKRVVSRIKEECPDVEWKQNYVVLGPYDYLDVFNAPSMDDALKVSAVMRSFGRSHTEIWGASEWKEFKTMLRSMAGQ